MNNNNLVASSVSHCQGSSRRSSLPHLKPLGNCNRNLKLSDRCPIVNEVDSKKKGENNQDLTTCESPEEFSQEKLKCICFRPPNAYECGRCHQYFYGRICEVCPMHKSEIYLMDFQHCPYCIGSINQIAIANKTWEEIRKFEEAELPGGDDGL